ncbi:acyl-CoA carboxylase epsilon subunit [Umezawaea sp. Da 62-37]|uniref:acyl-CoA carboxylase epsilon subunit n=1 Tax=Umezawaea sp. Da 62-37 TaxID=3075927 RepID=UPI0028F72E4C|nr:acyl-CoA carboxylase epsilon subunit [Umezawaea sp. Da 62-37]WNV91896.1 acyl-CoA carboxylase epsilon subunit [Umezawaea sp. Da 62-37]
MRGEPDEVEVAALVAVVVGGVGSGVGAGSASAPGGRSVWGDPGRRVRGVLRAGPGAWRASGLPG